jgi:diguanylate cyclase (GGDEF)-like protein
MKTARSSGPSGSPETPASSDEGLTSPEAVQGAVGTHRRYRSLLHRSRLLGTAFWVAMAYFLFWSIPWFRAIPWLPGGLTTEDYTERVSLTLILAAFCGVLGVGTLILRDHLLRTREALLAWTAVYDEVTGLYNRQYFFDRLSLECERARRQGTTFSLFLMRFEPSTGQGRGPGSNALRHLGAVLTETMRSNDLVALLGGNELAVVAMGVPRKDAPLVVQRLEAALEGSLAGLNLRMGVATYSARTRNAGTLLRFARASVKGTSPEEEADDQEGLVA